MSATPCSGERSAAALGASLAIGGSLLGPVIFFLLFNIVRLASLYFGVVYGYNKGIDLVVRDLGGNLLQKITEGATILGMFVMGALIAKWTHIDIPVVVSEIMSPDGTVVVTTVQNILDQLMPGMLGLGLTLLLCKLLRQNINPITLIFGLFAVGIIGAWLGILA